VDERDRPIRERIDFNTGIVVLDMRMETRPVRVAEHKTGRFEWVEQPTLIVVGLDPTEGGVIERSEISDRADPLRKELRQR
jgi:hypothetical protein